MHHGGDTIGWPWDHSRCPTIWRAWQAYHYRPGTGAFDIFYNSGVCPHGYRFEGRGPGVQTGANGTPEGNRLSYAFVYIGGEHDPLTDAAKEAFLDEQERFNAPIQYVHHDWKSTTCPGVDRTQWVRAGCPPPTKKQEKDDDMPHFGYDSKGQPYYITAQSCRGITKKAASRLAYLGVEEIPSDLVDMSLDPVDGWQIIEGESTDDEDQPF